MARLTPQTLDQMRAACARPRQWIKVGLSTSGRAAGAQAVFDALRQGVADRGLDVPVLRTGCAGNCSDEPLVEMEVEGVPRTMYGHVDAGIAQWLLDSHVQARRIADKHKVRGFSELVRPEDDPPAKNERGDTLHRQYRIVLRNCGVIDPQSIGDYIAADGYQALSRCLTHYSPEQVIEQIEASGLRGRGGAGFPTGTKWRLTRETPGEEKWVICNGDEGDPGAYMDRCVLEDDPHAVIEGLAIAAYAQGASHGFFYIRAEYPLAVQRIGHALAQARRLGLLGRNILGSTFSLDLEVRLGAGAFVCGEETALIASIEGRRGTPRPRPPYPSQRGLFDCPTTINNVETLANVPRIILKGAAWFGGIGTDGSTGTKVFAVSGHVARGGLIEVPMGTTLREIVEHMCGGSASGRPVKAVQTGGPSGGVIPAACFDTPVSYEHLRELGSIMGSGGLIVMDESDSMVELARFYLGFCVAESCGKCAPCRIGGKQMLHILDKLVAGRGTRSDLAALQRVGHAMQAASLCALGQTAPNPVLSTLRSFADEYAALVDGGKAGRP